MARTRVAFRYAFTVTHGALRIRVKVLPTVHEIGLAYRAGERLKKDVKGCVIYGFFEANAFRSRLVGTIYLCENSRLFEIVPHEVCHAVMHYLKTVSWDDDSDEKLASTVGLLTARILTKMDQSE